LETARAEGYGFLVELKYRAYRLGLRLLEHPVDWPNRHTGKSKMSKKIIFESFLLPWRILWAHRVTPPPRHRSL
ncbi:MAG: hypothetical protein WD972_02215, partial [Candidatus Andersenbacteria bacterium]